MGELRKKILSITTQLQLSGLATITEEGKPWVRYVITVGADDMNIRFATSISTRKVKQIELNPEVHLTCGVKDPMNMAPYLQIQGRARFTREKEERHGFWNDMLKPIFSGPDDPDYGVIIVEPYRIEYCTPGTFVPEVWQA
jgi:general stress protein 26